MILKALEMQGFKSFPEKTTLSFGKGITAVVGPNGSGKSNISDAVRWVLGEQSTKSLRGSKMEDVIFDGTKVRKAYGFAQVTLRLDNRDRSISSVDEDEVAVTRKYYRSGESEYKINGKNVRLRDVHELFMDTGLGRDGYSMVSQGKIADMISGKGSECRDMLEEAAGISAYRYRRSDSIKKLDKAEENLIRLRDILSELEARIGPLKTQSEKAQKFLVLAEERKTLEIGLWLYNIDKLRTQLKKQDDSIAITASQYDAVVKELATLEESIERTISLSQEITAEIDAIRLEIAENEQKASASDAECAVLQGTIEHNNDTISRIIRDKDSSAQTKEQLEREIKNDEKLILQLRTAQNQKNDEYSRIEKSLQAQKLLGSDIDRKIAELTQLVAEKTESLSEIRIAESTAVSSSNEIRSRNELLTAALSQRQAEKESLTRERAEKQNALTTQKEKIDTLSNIVEGLTIKYRNKNNRADKLKKELDELSFEVSHLLSKIKMLEDLEKSMEGYSGAVKAVMKAKNKGDLDGIHATVSQIISTDEEYTVAIETALGNAIQNIVCTSENDAKRAIGMLKRNGAGRATFLPISSVKGKRFDEAGLESCDGFIGLADGLVETDSQYREIVRSLLGRTVVAENLNLAVEIAKKYAYRFKIVTLDGQVINAGGSITGGSQSKNAGFLSRPVEIEHMKESHKEKSEKLSELRAEYEKLDAELLAEEKEIEQKKTELSELQESKIRLEGEFKLSNEQYLSVEKACSDLEDELRTTADRLSELSGRINSDRNRMTVISEEIKSCENEISALGRQKQEVSQKDEDIASKLSRLKLELHDTAKDIAARTDSMNLLKARLINAEDKDKELDDEIAGLNRQNGEIKLKIEALRKDSSDLRFHNQKLQSQITALQVKRSESEEQSVKLRALERSKTAEREDLGGEKARLEERRESMQIEYDSTISKLFDEYQLTQREALNLTGKCEDPKEARRSLTEIKGKIRALGSVNVGAIDEYKEVNERYTFMSAQLDDIEKSKKELTRLIADLTDKMSGQFREQFGKINAYFGETFAELFGGGKAELILVDPTDVLESEIDIKLQPPGKNVKRLDSLSGGEKGLSAISLLFAILKVNPAPFCIFDEVEAALDDVNVTRYAQYVRRMTKNTQFILITHRRGTMEEADMLYGITMQEQGVSKLLELHTAELAGKLGIV